MNMRTVVEYLPLVWYLVSKAADRVSDQILQRALVDAEARGEIDAAISILVVYQKQNARVDYTLGILYEKSEKPALSHISFARYFFKTYKYKASLYHIDKALEFEKDLDKGLVDEMNEMKKFIRKQEPS